MGYTVLGLPGNFTKEQVEASSGIPPMPEGVNQVMLKGMVALIGISKKYGYDSTKHYRELSLDHLLHISASLELETNSKEKIARE